MKDCNNFVFSLTRIFNFVFSVVLQYVYILLCVFQCLRLHEIMILFLFFGLVLVNLQKSDFSLFSHFAIVQIYV